MDFFEKSNECRYMRRVAFASVVVSVLAVTGAVVSLPLVYSYVQALQTHLDGEAQFCQFRARDMWVEVLALQTSTDWRRSKRSWLFGQWLEPNYSAQAQVHGGNRALLRRHVREKFLSLPVPGKRTKHTRPEFGRSQPDQRKNAIPFSEKQRDGGYFDFLDYQGAGLPIRSQPNFAAVPASPYARSRCGCPCRHGPPGPPGYPGQPGNDGFPGIPGKRGRNGRPGKLLRAKYPLEPCVTCPPGPDGMMGMMGPKGPTGPKGNPGKPGEDGNLGHQGLPGPAGKLGMPGPPGIKGRKGRDGSVVIVAGPPGPPGLPGAQGFRGSPGKPGRNAKDGLPGDNGHRGTIGDRGIPGLLGPIGPPGLPGHRGFRGHCGHCPPPRLPPGYFPADWKTI